MDPFTKLIDCENDFANSEVLLYNLADDSLFFELNSLDKESILSAHLFKVSSDF